MATVGIGVIGCGLRARALVGQMLARSKHVKVTAVCDVSPKAAASAKEAFGNHATVHADYHDLVADPNVQWVMVGSWNCYHAEQVVAAFQAGKNVFCEKPLAVTVDDCLAMRDAWRTSKKAFFIGYTLRYSPMYRKVQELLTAGAIGRPISLEFNETLAFGHGGYIHADWRRDSKLAGPHILEKCSHDVDLVNWMLGSLAVKAASFGGCNFFTPQYRHRVDEIGLAPDGRRSYCEQRGVPGLDPPLADPFGPDKDIVDNQVAILEYENSVRASFHTNLNAALPERRLYICGTEGAIRAGMAPNQIELCRIAWDATPEIVTTAASGKHGGGNTILTDSLLASMIHDAPPDTSMTDGVTSAITCLGIDEAMRTGTVVDLRPTWRRAGLMP